MRAHNCYSFFIHLQQNCFKTPIDHDYENSNKSLCKLIKTVVILTTMIFSFLLALVLPLECIRIETIRYMSYHSHKIAYMIYISKLSFVKSLKIILISIFNYCNKYAIRTTKKCHRKSNVLWSDDHFSLSEIYKQNYMYHYLHWVIIIRFLCPGSFMNDL